MDRTSMVVLAAALTLFMSGQAQALTLMNRDVTSHRLQISETSEEPTEQSIIIAVNQTRDDLCEEGCTITLTNGAQASFEGDEYVYIQDGDFVVSE